jgi:methyl acetate hydrolase
MKNLIIYSGIFITLFSCKADSGQSGLFPSQESITQQMDSILKDSDLLGLAAIAIKKNGEKVEYTYGNSVWNTDKPLKTNSIFRIASMTKLLTSVAILQLVEKDSIGLDEDLSNILPEMTSIPILTDDRVLIEGKNSITLRQLLTHTSGFGYYFTDSLLATYDATNWNYEDLPRRFEAGTQFLYGTSTNWVGKLIEKISGLTLEDYFRIHVTGPLKMNRTWYNVPDSLKTEIVSYGLRKSNGTQEISEFPDRIPETKTNVFIGGGRMFSTPEDYTKLLACILNNGIYDGGQILQKATIDQMFEDQTNSISMDIKNNYFQVDYCCDFRGLIKPTSKWGLAGLIDTEMTSYGRKEGTLLWGGVYNTYWYIDRKSGIAASIYTQYLPFNHPETTTVFDKFSKFIYENLK